MAYFWEFLLDQDGSLIVSSFRPMEEEGGGELPVCVSEVHMLQTSSLQHAPDGYDEWWLHTCVAVCCSVLHCVAVCCSVLQCVAVCCSVLHAVCCSVLQCVAVCCSVLECIAVCCIVLHCVAVCCSGVSAKTCAEHASDGHRPRTVKSYSNRTPILSKSYFYY